MIRNRNARRRLRALLREIDSPVLDSELSEEAAELVERMYRRGPIATSLHVIVAPGGYDSLPNRAGWQRMRAAKAAS